MESSSAPVNPGDRIVTVAANKSFMVICKLLEKLESLKSKKGGNVTQMRKSLLQNFIDDWRRAHQTLHSTISAAADSFHPALRLLLPHLEKERAAYGIKETTLAKLYIEVLCLGKESTDAAKLLNYKAPKVARGNVGDFASVAYFVLKSRCPAQGSLTIKDVNDCLDDIASNNAQKDKDGVRRVVRRLLTNLSALEQKWLIRMMMKELKCGVSQQTVFATFHEDAEDLYNVTNSLEKVSVQLHDPNVRLHEIGITIFSPFRPMLGERGRPAEVEKLMEGKDYFIETKYDGERMQLHKEADEYRYFSRGGNDYSETFGKTSSGGTLTPHIHSGFLADVRTCIIDGEMMGYDSVSDTLGSKGENFDIKSKDVVSSHGYQPCYAVFDVLMYNGKVLSNLPLKERCEYLPKIVRQIKGRLFISEKKIGTTKADCAEALNEAIEKRDEGIMIKDPESPYKPNTRRGGWFKIKPEYVGGLMDELDVLIVGGYFGVGHRAGMLSHFLCGLAVPCADGEQPDTFYSFCKVGSGYTKKELFHLNRRLSDHWQPFNKKQPPSCLVLATGQKERPDVWLEPNKSAIIQVKAAEIIYSDRYKTQSTLRFPRVEKIRADKHWYECMTITELETMKQKSDGKLTNAYDLGDDVSPTKKARKGVVRSTVRPSVAAQYRGVDGAAVTKVSEVFAGKEFCVVAGTAEFSKTDLEKNILEFGGAVTQNPDVKTTYCIVAGKNSGIKLKNFIDSGSYDVVKADWLIRSVQHRTQIDWIPSDMWHATPATVAQFARRYDHYGDSYYNDTDVTQLRKVFEKIDQKHREACQYVSPEQVVDLESEYFPDDSPLGLFRSCRIYMDDKLIVGDVTTRVANCELELVTLELRFHGAVIVDVMDAKISHVVVSVHDLSRLKHLRNEAKQRNRKFHVVTSSWVAESRKAASLLNERHFEPLVLR